MKKIRLFVLLLLAVCMLCGCGDASADVSNKGELLLQVGDTKITKGDFYSDMLSQDNGDYIIKEAARIVVNAEIETTEDITKRADQQLEDTVKKYEDDLDKALEQLGYDSRDELYADILVSVKSEDLSDKYIEANLETLYTDYTPLKIRLMYFTTEENEQETYMERAAMALSEVKGGANFKEVAEKYCDKDDVKQADETLYTTSSALDSMVAEYLKDVTSPGLSEVIPDSKKTGAYIVQVTVSNREQLKSDFVSYLKSTDTFSQKMYGYYMKQHNFTVYDIDTFNILKPVYGSYMKQVKEDK